MSNSIVQPTNSGWPTSVRQWIAATLFVAGSAAATFLMASSIFAAFFMAIAAIIAVRLRFSRIGRWSFLPGYLLAGVVTIAVIVCLSWLLFGPLGGGAHNPRSGADLGLDLATLPILGTAVGLCLAAGEIVLLVCDGRPDSDAPALEDRWLPENRWARSAALAGGLAILLAAIGWSALEFGLPAAHAWTISRWSTVVRQDPATPDLTPLQQFVGSSLIEPYKVHATYFEEKFREALTARGVFVHRQYEFAAVRDEAAHYHMWDRLSVDIDAPWYQMRVETPYMAGDPMRVDVWDTPERMADWTVALGKLGAHARE